MVISILLRCCDVSHLCHVLGNKSQPMPNPFAFVAPAERPESPTHGHSSSMPSFLIPHSRLPPIDRPFLMRIPTNFEEYLFKPQYAALPSFLPFLHEHPSILVLLFSVHMNTSFTLLLFSSFFL